MPCGLDRLFNIRAKSITLIAGGVVAVQIFLSYARIDNELPAHMSDGTGFVTCLDEQLSWALRQGGDVDTKIWRDTRGIDPVDQFDEIIRENVDKSDLFLVVLSPNWMNSRYCKLELDRFKDRWKNEGEEKVKHRVLIAHKRNVPVQKRYSLLQGQEGQRFFDFEGPGESGQEFEYFDRGKVRDAKYNLAVEKLARSLFLRAQRLEKKGDGQRLIDEGEEVYTGSRANTLRAKDPLSSDSLKIYLAKPASDMREAYSRVVEELSGSGYFVVPDAATDIPYDSTASHFIDEALAGAAISIHLIGEGSGYAPEQNDPIVKLQLARAKMRAGRTDDANGSQSNFSRIIWAPEILDGRIGQSAQTESTKEVTSKKRDPQEVFARFGDYLPTIDKVLGGTLSKLVDFLNEHITERSSHSEVLPSSLSEDGWVYVYHSPADLKYAIDLTKALRQRGIAADLPALEGPPAEVIAHHDTCLQECNAVVLCWANESVVWARARAHQLNWKKLGRREKFAYRGLFAGPPPDAQKSVLVQLPPNEIDIIIDVTKGEKPITEAIEPFVQRARQNAQ